MSTSRLFSSRPARLNLAGVAISAKLCGDGKLEKIGGEYAKVLAARFEKALPRIHTVGFAEEQRAAVKETHPELLDIDKDHLVNFRVVFAPTLDGLIRKVIRETKKRFDGAESATRRPSGGGTAALSAGTGISRWCCNSSGHPAVATC